MSLKKQLAKKATDFDLLLSFIESNYKEVTPQQAINRLLGKESASTIKKVGEDFQFVTYSIGSSPPMNNDRLFESSPTTIGKKSSKLTLSEMLDMEWFVSKDDEEEAE